MKSTVLIKSNRYGITVILDDQISFDELVADVEEKFKDSAKFFEQAKLAVSFEGRKLTDEEEKRLIKAITDNCELEIACVVDHNTDREDNFRRVMESTAPLSGTESGQFYKGTLRSGQVLESETSVVVLGDVNPGSKVIAVGNIVVLGALKGTAWAGVTGNDKAFVVACLVSLGLQIVVITVPQLAIIFKVVPLSFDHWIVVAGLSFIPMIFTEIRKIFIKG